MYQDLLAVFKDKPTVYESTGLPFWDDAHISQSMLKAHLSPGTDGASRSFAFMDASAAWVASQLPIQQGKHLLDVGCGPGLYARRFACQGFAVTGIDFSRRSIRYATEQAAQAGLPIRYQYQDYLTMTFSNEFDIAVLIYCDFGVLSPANRELLLQKIHKALKPGGVFVLDVFTPTQYASFQEGSTATYHDGGFWSPLPHLCIKRDIAYPDRHYLEQYTIVTQSTCSTYHLWDHAFTAEELLADLTRAGFTSVSLYGDVAGVPLQKTSTTLCAVCHKL